MQRDELDLTRLRPTGGKHSSKRDQILRIFLQQEGHLSADDLFDLVRRQAPGIGRATVYRTLQWMVEAGIARKVDFGEGRSRYEPSYGHPRHFHLICNDCHRSSEFLSSDIETLVEEVASPGMVHADANGRTDHGCARSAGPGGPHFGRSTARRPSSCLPGCACGSRSPPNAAASRFYTRGGSLTRIPAGAFQKLAAEEREHLATLEQRYRELIATDPALETRPTFLFFKGAANGLFDEGAAKLSKGVNDQQALLIGIKCERGSHNFFKRYGERFEDSQGKQIFLEFAAAEREHLDLLIREYRALTDRQRPRLRRAGGLHSRSAR
jgi:Fur family ferric uptake transcriptional regulator